MREGAASADPLERLEDVREAMEFAVGFAEGMSLEEFEGDARTAFAVERALEIVGEAAKNVPRELRDRHPGLPWRRMAGMRDRLVHGYARVDRAIVHRTATELIPALLPEVSRVIEEERRAARPVDASEPGHERKGDEDR